MVDREKVVKGLHCCAHTDGTNCIYCPYDLSDSDCTALMSMDVLALLEEQVEPKRIGQGWFCVACDALLTIDNEKIVKFCSMCGKPIKWK